MRELWVDVKRFVKNLFCKHSWHGFAYGLERCVKCERVR